MFIVINTKVRISHLIAVVAACGILLSASAFICPHLHLCGPLMRRALLESLPHRANDISMRK